MLSWGEDYRQSFRLKKGSSPRTSDGVRLLKPSFHVMDLSAGRNVLGFIKDTGEALIIRTHEREDGRTRGRQKFIKCDATMEAVSCSDDVVTFLSNGGRVFCVDSRLTPFTPSSPVVFSNKTVTQVACGNQHTVALTQDGQVYTWGSDSRGQLGLGKRASGSGSGSGSPQLLPSLSSVPVVLVRAGGEQSFVLTVSGGVLGWGRNDCGQLGLGDTEDRHTAAPVHLLNMKKVVGLSCGNQHTAALTKDGVVFTFGSGRYGQLGHNSFQDELRPRLVAELWGSKVIQTACGGNHTLVLTDSMKVYSCGRNDQQQLGREEDGPPSVPLPVQLQQGEDRRLVIEKLFAGGDCSFATCAQDVHRRSNGDTTSSRTPQSLQSLVDRWTSECHSKFKEIKKEIHRAFSSASFLNRSFLHQSDRHFWTSPSSAGLDLPLAHRVFRQLVEEDAVLAEVEAAVLQLLPSLDVRPVGLEGLRLFLVLNELLHVIQKHKGPQNTRLAQEVAAAVQKLPAESLQVLGSWWFSLSSAVMIRHVKVWRSTLSELLSVRPVPHSSVRNVLLVLQNMFNANQKKIPEKTFCSEVNQRFLQEELQRWRRASEEEEVSDPPLLLWDFLFVLDLKSKKFLFDENSAVSQAEHQAPPPLVFHPFLGWIPQWNPGSFQLNLRRASLVGDAFVQLAAARQADLRKPLLVCFDGDTKISDVYRRDFFHHLFLRIVRDKSELFMLNDSETLAWFSSRVPEEEKTDFYVFGVLCGLAFYNNSIIHLPFPLVLFKKLLDVEATLEDLMEFSPTVGRSLWCIWNQEEDDLEEQDLTFQINWDETDVDLDPRHPEKLVTNQNKKEFIDAYVDHAFNTSVESVFQEFRRGFFLVCEPRLVRLFQPQELQGVLVGEKACDWTRFKQNTSYEGSFHPRHPAVQMFWEVFDDLTEEQRKDFLWFLTGFRRTPILGTDQIRMRVRNQEIQSDSQDQYFPESLTCHCILALPSYSTKEIMYDRLTEALKPEREFMEGESAGPGSDPIQEH